MPVSGTTTKNYLLTFILDQPGGPVRVYTQVSGGGQTTTDVSSPLSIPVYLPAGSGSVRLTIGFQSVGKAPQEGGLYALTDPYQQGGIGEVYLGPLFVNGVDVKVVK